MYCGEGERGRDGESWSIRAYLAKLGTVQCTARFLWCWTAPCETEGRVAVSIALESICL